MGSPQNLMEVYRLLDKSNCRDCGEKTCMAFAAAVFKGSRTLSECTHLDHKGVDQLRAGEPQVPATESNGSDGLEKLRQQVAAIDLAAAAPRLEGEYADGYLILRVLGKTVRIDAQGRVITDIHVNPWLLQPLYSYILHNSDLPLARQWVSFRELHEGAVRYPLFQKRAEQAIQKVADIYIDLFDDMVHLFSGKRVTNHYQADITMVLYPLPKMPLLICYWKPDDGLASSLNLFFDAHADRMMDIGAIFSLGAGLARMFEKLAVRHGYRFL